MGPIETLIAERPHFHALPDGKPANWAVAPEVLRFVHDMLEPDMRTLETGAGQTTVAFAIAGTEHICITPDRAQAERIRAYCADHGIKDALTFIHQSSDVALASGQGIPDTLDFVLIDGAHRFPFPIIDWHFTERRLRVGGIVAIDDCLIPSVRILHDFLMCEDDWELVRMFHHTSFFRRRSATADVGDFVGQKINKSYVEKQAQRSHALQRTGLVARVFRRFLR